jgi:hypothetical protein
MTPPLQQRRRPAAAIGEAVILAVAVGLGVAFFLLSTATMAAERPLLSPAAYAAAAVLGTGGWIFTLWRFTAPRVK